MSYSTSNPPQCLTVGGVGGVVPNIWFYSSTDNAAAVDDPGYFTDAKKLGIKAKDIIIVEDNDASPVILTIHRAISYSGDTLTISTGNTLVTGTAGS